MDTNVQKGRSGEEIAVSFLKKSGYKIVERNYKCIFGEMDIIAKEADTIVFLEVKSRRTEKYGTPQEAVGKTKQEKLSRIALYYLKKKRLGSVSARFDVVSIRFLPGEQYRAEIIKNAFELAFGR